MATPDSHQKRIAEAEQMLDKAQGGATGRAVSSVTGIAWYIIKSILYLILGLIVVVIVYALFG